MHFNFELQIKMLFEMQMKFEMHFKMLIEMKMNIEIEMQIKMLFPLVAKARKSHKWPRTAMGVQTKQGASKQHCRHYEYPLHAISMAKNKMREF